MIVDVSDTCLNLLLKSYRFAIMEFYTENESTCKEQTQELVNFQTALAAGELGGSDVLIIRTNVEEQPILAKEAIIGITPVLVLYEDENPIEKIEGIVSAETLINKFKDLKNGLYSR